MSESAKMAPAGGTTKADDPLTALAKDIYARLAAARYAAAGGGGTVPDAKELAKLSLQLANAFLEAYEEVNAEALAAERRRQSFSADDLDIESLLGRK